MSNRIEVASRQLASRAGTAQDSQEVFGPGVANFADSALQVHTQPVSLEHDPRKDRTMLFQGKRNSLSTREITVAPEPNIFNDSEMNRTQDCSSVQRFTSGAGKSRAQLYQTIVPSDMKSLNFISSKRAGIKNGVFTP